MIRIGDFQIGTEERQAINRVLDSGRISEWREVKAFEDEFADWLNVKHCVALNSGTAALMVGIKSLEILGHIPHNAKILIPALTFIATANAAKLTGHMPIFGDVDFHSFCLQPCEVSNKAADLVLPVHLFGFVADMFEIGKRAKLVCEDACEAHGSTHNGQKVGGLGTWGAFSFYIAHTVQAGELGCLVTNDSDIAQVARSLKAHGRACNCKVCTRHTTGCPHLKGGDLRFLSLYSGWNFKPMEFQAALARVQLRKVEENCQRRQYNAMKLTEKMSAVDNLILPNFGANEVPMAYPILLRRGDRNKLLVDLERAGIECRPCFGSIPNEQPAYRQDHKTEVADYIGEHGFYVGCHQYLTDSDLEQMANVIAERATNEKV